MYIPQVQFTAKRHWREVQRTRRISPRVRLAARLYASGLAPTKGQAADAAGLSRQTFYLVSSPGVDNPEIKNLLGETDRIVLDKTATLSSRVHALADRAVETLHRLVQSNNEHVALKAASDVLDRVPETSKTLKHEVRGGFALGHEEAKLLATALAAGARVREKNELLASGNVVHVEIEEPTSNGKTKEIPGPEGDSGDYVEASGTAPGSDSRSEAQGKTNP